ncbi:MAG: hypothetical protein KIH80_004075, partial [Flavobacteriia bacterium]|nr:hypothetical protein [Flavobacteriia bacterium]
MPNCFHFYSNLYLTNFCKATPCSFVFNKIVFGSDEKQSNDLKNVPQTKYSNFFILIILFTALFSIEGHSQKINIETFNTHYGNGTLNTYDENDDDDPYNGLAYSHEELDDMTDASHPGTTLHLSGTVHPITSNVFNGGFYFKPGDSYFSAKYYGWFKPAETGTYSFSLNSDDASEFLIEGIGKTDDIAVKLYGCCETTYGNATLNKDTWYKFEVRFQEYGGGEYLYLKYIPPSGGEYKVIDSDFAVFNPTLPKGKITIVETGGDDENDTWEINNNTITTLTDSKINSSIIEGFANSNTITITANSISIEDDLNVTTSGNGIIFKAKSDITVSSVITTTNGNITLWSDSDGDSSGRIGILNGGIATGGGDISLVGGSSGDGYAVGNNNSITDFQNYRGIWINNSTLNANGTSSGGDIIINGKGYTSVVNDYNIGVDFVINTAVKTNHSGEITVNGIGGPHTASGNHGAGINFYYQPIIHTESGNLTLKGIAGGGSATTARLDAGINFDGGGTFDAKIYSTSGNISLKGTKSSLSNSYGIMNGIDNIPTYIGTDGTTKTSGNIIIQTDNFDFQESYHTIETTGTLSLKSISDSFTSAFDSEDIYISSTLSGLTIGTITNTANITISDDIEVAGPISILGGYLNIQGNIESTSSGDISLKGYTEAANYGITLNNNKSIVSNNGNIDIHATGGTTYYGLNLGSNSKIEAKGSNKKLEVTAEGHSSGGGIYMNTSATISATGNINIYANGGTDSNGIDLGSHAQIRSTSANVHINAIGYRGVWGRNNSHSIRANNDLTILSLIHI